MTKLATPADYQNILDDRPEKFDEEQVGYGPAPEGSAMRCAACLHYFRRAIDGFAVCEIFRSEKADAEGVLPDWRCVFYTINGTVHPLYPEDEEDDEPELAKDDAPEQDEI